MERTNLFGAALLCAGSLSYGPPFEELLRERDHGAIGKDVASYWEAQRATKDIQETFDDLAETIEKAQGKLDDGQDILALVDDWEKIFQLATIELLEDRVRKGSVTSETALAPGGGELRFAYHAPKSYAARRGPYPLLLIAPDAGEEAEAHLEEEWADPALRDGAVLVVVELEAPPEEWDGEGGVFTLMSGFGAAAERFAIDYDRVFLAGSGQGFQAAGATANAFRQLFAGLVGRGEFEAVETRNLRNVPSLLLSGGEAAQAFERKIDELGFGNVTREEEGGPQRVWEWMQGQERDGYPARLSFAPYAPYAQQGHWISCRGVNFDDDPWVDATFDRDANSVTIDAEKVSQVEIFLNDAMVDLARPVKVVVNGNVHEELYPRNKRRMIDLVFRQGDWGRVFPVIQTFDVPVKDKE